MPTKIDVSYDTEEYDVTLDDINNEKFLRMKHRRKISPSIIKKIYAGLLKKKNFEAPLVVNRVNGQFRIIDGNHRFEAVEKLITNKPESIVTVVLHVYDNITDDQERHVFGIWNMGRRQTADDYLQMYRARLPVLKKLNKVMPCPVTVYAKQGAVKLSKLALAHYATIETNHLGVIRAYSSWEMTDILREMGDKDVKEMRDFMYDYLKEFEVLQGSPYFSTNHFATCMKIWKENRKSHGGKNIMRRLNKISSLKRFENMKGLTSSSAINFVYDEILAMANHGQKKKLK